MILMQAILLMFIYLSIRIFLFYQIADFFYIFPSNHFGNANIFTFLKLFGLFVYKVYRKK